MSFLKKFCELWLLIGRGDRTHPYLSPHPTSSHNSQYFRRTVLAKICGAIVSRNYRETIAKLSVRSAYLQKFCELWLLIGRGDRTHPYLSPHPTSSHNSQYFWRNDDFGAPVVTSLVGKLSYITGSTHVLFCIIL